MDDNRERYLELMKKAVGFELWDEPGVPMTALTAGMSRRKHLPAKLLSKAIGRFGVALTLSTELEAVERRAGRMWPRYAHTMIGRARLDHLQHCVECVLADCVPGDLLEAGVWRGGACIFMAAL